MVNRWKQVIVIWLVIFGITLADQNSVLAARLLTATIDLNGQRMLESAYTDRGTERPEQVWRYVSRAPGWASVSKITAEANDPLRSRMEGNVVIRISHVDRPIVEARASQLTLIRNDASQDLWYLSAEEVERIAEECGLARPSRWDEFRWLFWPATIGSAGFGIALIVLLLSWRKKGLVLWVR